MSALVRPYAAIAAAAAAAALVLPSAAQATAISVTTASDTVASDGVCSLREAVQAANTDAPVGDCPAGSGADQISLGATPYTLMAGQLDVTSELTITGAGAAATTIDGNHNGRVLNVTSAGKLTIDGILVTGGKTGNGADGGPSTGHDPFNSVSGGTGGNGGNGGGIANAGTLTIIGSRVTGNTTGNGGKGGNATGAPGQTSPVSHPDGGFAFGGTPGAGGKGGGVYSSGTLTITGSTIDTNTTGNGGVGGNGTGGQALAGNFNGGGGHGRDGGQGGSGGGVYALGLVTITGSTITGNTTGNGGDGGDGHGADGNGTTGNAGDGTGGVGGLGGDGGGIFATTLTASDDTITGNTTGAGAHGGQGFGGTGGTSGASGAGKGGKGGVGGNGGGLFAEFSPGKGLSFDRSLLASNHTGGGGHGGSAQSGATTHGGDGGTGGSGGGLLVGTGTASAANLTFTANSTGAGGDRGTGPPLDPLGSADYGKGGDGGSGGAAHVFLGPFQLTNATVSGNSEGGGGAGNPVGAQGGGSVSHSTGTTFSVGGSILDGACGSVTDSGGNLQTVGSPGCPGTPGDPKLGPLQDNGGPTRTMAIGTTGDAFDKIAPGSTGCTAATDQRGATRPSGAACEIGAYEVAPPVATTGDATAIGATTAAPGGTLDPRGLRTRWYFDYGTSSSYGAVTADQFASGGSAGVAATLTGLTPDTTYHYRLVGVGPDGTSTGADRTFTTSKLPPPVPTLPKITGVKLKPKKFRVSGKKPTGTTISYRNTVASLTTFTVLRPAPGVRIKGKCLKPSKKRHGKRCTRYVAVGRFTHLDVAGLNRFHWGGKVGGHKLRRGNYKLRAVPVAGVLAGKPVTVSFRVIR
jgi:CSLREA domain-containing protein